MNEYVNIERIEFLVTKKCSGKCKHCSVITNIENPDKSYKDFEKLKQVMKFLLDNFRITSIMTYGGEPLLFSDITAQIHEIGKSYAVDKRELITNGYFSKKRDTINSVVKRIIDAGVNSIMLSMDAFHQEKIPFKYVEYFIESIILLKFENIKIHPAWVVSRENNNVYNKKTKEIIRNINRYKLKISSGNNIVLSGLAKKNLKSYYTKQKLNLKEYCGEIAFTNYLTNLKSIRILPNGNINICRGLTIGNIYKENIENIIREYNPYKNRVMSLLLNGGIKMLHQYAEMEQNIINVEDYYSACDLCTDCIRVINSETI